MALLIGSCVQESVFAESTLTTEAIIRRSFRVEFSENIKLETKISWRIFLWSQGRVLCINFMTDFSMVPRESFWEWRILVCPLSSSKKTIGKCRLTNVLCHDDSLKIGRPYFASARGHPRMWPLNREGGCEIIFRTSKNYFTSASIFFWKNFPDVK